MIGWDAAQYANTPEGQANIDEYLKNRDKPTAAPWLSSAWDTLKKKMSYLTPGMGAAGEYLNPSYGGASIDPVTGNFRTPNAGGLGISPPPAAMGPPGGGATTNNDNKQITLNQSNSVTVQVQDDSGLASRITKSISDYTGEMFSGIARDFGRSSPRTETATQ
jgi:hypothetical protein